VDLAPAIRPLVLEPGALLGGARIDPMPASKDF
jgi:hypothetical protein